MNTSRPSFPHATRLQQKKGASQTMCQNPIADTDETCHLLYISRALTVAQLHRPKLRLATNPPSSHIASAPARVPSQEVGSTNRSASSDASAAGTSFPQPATHPRSPQPLRSQRPQSHRSRASATLSSLTLLAALGARYGWLAQQGATSGSIGQQG